jgi:glycosyltransferase involved in cell wall biosynthesis
LAPLCEKFEATHHRLEESRGPAFARNTGADITDRPILFFMDADVAYPSGLFERAELELARNRTLHAVSFMSQGYDKNDGAIQNFGAAIEDYWCRQHLGSEKLVLVPGFATRNGAVRREAFEAVGGFDTSFKTNALEDYDFGKRLSEKFNVALADEPVVYHNYPATLRRLIRNNLVRAALFVPYAIATRPQLDQGQISAAEAGTRLVAAASLLFLALATLPIPFRQLWIIGAMVCLLIYVWRLMAFLQSARRVSGRWLFTVQCLILHYLTSLATIAGGGIGLLLYVTRLVRYPQKSPENHA